ncbi:MAG: endonuclease III domain-containing protein [Bacillota bacterium]
MKDVLLEIYGLLDAHFGPRGWWPADTPFEVCVGAILTQNVAWRNVVRAIANLDREGLMNLHSIHSAPHEIIAGLVRPTRYYNQKAHKLKNFCSMVVERHHGDLNRLFGLPVPELRSELLAVRGIGKETADSIILYAAEKPVFVVDLYTARIFSRLGVIPEALKYDEIQEFFTRNLPLSVELFNQYHALIDGAGNRFCSAGRPRCNECPLAGRCRYHLDEKEKQREQ